MYHDGSGSDTRALVVHGRDENDISSGQAGRKANKETKIMSDITAQC